MTSLEATRKRIDELCNANNMNINQLAIASGINLSTIRSIFKVIKKAPYSDTIFYICIGFGMSIKDFYYVENLLICSYYLLPFKRVFIFFYCNLIRHNIFL